MQRYNYKGYILQLKKMIDRSSLRLFLEVLDPPPEHILRVEGEVIAKVYYLDLHFGIVSSEKVIYILVFNKDGSFQKGITGNFSDIPKSY